MTDRLIYKILTQAQWRQAEAERVFRGAPIDLADGYIHLSAAGQVQGTADRHFAGMHDLVLAAIEAGKLGDKLVYEISRGDALFPHLYDVLDLAHVKWVKPMPLGKRGRHELPDLAS
jgi:uncharacterized protein (DUF952 family)